MVVRELIFHFSVLTDFQAQIFLYLYRTPVRGGYASVRKLLHRCIAGVPLMYSYTHPPDWLTWLWHNGAWLPATNASDVTPHQKPNYHIHTKRDLAQESRTAGRLARAGNLPGGDFRAAAG